MTDIIDRLQTLVRHGRDQGMKMNDVEDAWREIKQLRESNRTFADHAILGVAQGVGNSGESAQPATGPMRFDLMLEKVDAENAQNGEAFNDMRAHIWAAGASHEDSDFITRMLTRKGLYLFQAEPWKRCPSTHCERRGECASPRDCTVARPTSQITSTNGPAQSGTGVREATLKMVAVLFAESVHETYTREEIVSVVEDMIRLGCPSPSVASTTCGGVAK
jgi:hypothetical protein